MTCGEFLALLPVVRPTTRGWIARCPAHADKTPSLSIREGDDQRILLHCFGGCSTPQICTALRLRLADLFPVKPTPQLRKECRHRETFRLEQAQKQQERGLAIDVVREAERLIRSARNLQDSCKWTNAKRNRIMNQLADAYEVLGREGVLHEHAGV